MASQITYSPLRHTAKRTDEIEEKQAPTSFPRALSFEEFQPLSPLYECRSEGVLDEARNLLRYAKLDKDLPLQRTGLLDKLRGIWTNLPKPPSLQQVRDAISAPMRPMFRTFQVLVQSVYASEFEEPCDEISLAAKVAKFTGDSAVLRAFPITKATTGQKGPTFLVRYPHDAHQMQSYGFKWIPTEESLCQHVYNSFSRCFRSNPEEYCGFLVPVISTMDFKTGIHALPNLKHEEMTHSKELERTFREITRCYKSDPRDPNLMIFERIEGKDLLDFAKTDYSLLSIDQKKTLWKHLGRLAMLDVFMGNYDRIAHIAYKNGTEETPGQYSLEPIQSNMGNVLIKRGAEERMLVYAIDNAIDPDLIHNIANRKEYLAFLQTLLADPKVYSKLSANILESLHNSIEEQICDAGSSGSAADAQEAVETMRKSLSAFSQDLESADARDSLIAGLTQMGAWMNGNFYDAWLRSDIHKYLKTHSPKMCEALTERFACSRLLSSRT